MKIWSLIPLLRFEQGHPYSYHLAVGKACAFLGWEHEALIPVSCQIDPLPKTWKKVLAEEFFLEKEFVPIKRTYFQKIVSLCKSIPPLRKVLRQTKVDQAIFLEQFFLEQILAFAIAVLLTSVKAEVWLVHRYSTKQLGFKAYIYRCLHYLMACRVGTRRLKLCADSHLLAQDHKQFFRKDVHVLPIPHTEHEESFPIEKQEKDLLLWWPGALTTVSKGLKIIQQMAKCNRDGMTLVVAENAREHLVASSLRIHYVVNHLSRQEYMQWMQRIDLILLPYDPSIYHAATSGIFVEAVVSGKMVVVTSGTWMAYELERFNLQALIVKNWLVSNLFDYFVYCLKDVAIQQKIVTMQNAYKVFHSTKGFSQAMQMICS